MKLKTKDGKFSKNHAAKIHTHDAKAFGINTKDPGTFRNGHVLRGNVQDVHLITKRITYLILPRINKTDYDDIEKSGDKKEWNSIVNDQNLDVLTLDDIWFGKDVEGLKKKFQDLRKKYHKKDKSLSKSDGKKMREYNDKLKIGLIKGDFSIKK